MYHHAQWPCFYYYHYCGFVVYIEIGYGNALAPLFFMLRIALAIWYLLCFHVNFKKCFFYFCEEWGFWLGLNWMYRLLLVGHDINSTNTWTWEIFPLKNQSQPKWTLSQNVIKYCTQFLLPTPAHKREKYGRKNKFYLGVVACIFNIQKWEVEAGGLKSWG